jgi:hypothetical protein
MPTQANGVFLLYARKSAPLKSAVFVTAPSPFPAVCVHPDKHDCITQPTLCEWNKLLPLVSLLARNSCNYAARNNSESSNTFSTQWTMRF